jgi:hypothetical protein
MQLDFEIQRSTRRCAATQRSLEPGDICFSVLEVAGADVIRKDYCLDAWPGPPEVAIGWWKTRIPELSAKKIKLAPNDVLLQLFDQLAEHPENEDMRYVLALLLMRRRVLRFDAPLDDDQASTPRGGYQRETMVLYCPQRDASYSIAVAMPTSERIDEIQQRLGELLVADAA